MEDEELIEHDGTTSVISLGHHFLQTSSGNVIKVEHDNELDFEDNIIYRSEDESATEYEVCPSPSEEVDSNSGWQEVIR